MPNRDPDYPNVWCDKHPGKRPGYAVCSSIVERGVAIDRVIPPTPTEVGQIICAGRDENHMAFIICALCAVERGWLPS